MKVYNSKMMSEWDLVPEGRRLFETQTGKPNYQEVRPYMLFKKTQEVSRMELKYAIFTKQLANSI